MGKFHKILAVSLIGVSSMAGCSAEISAENSSESQGASNLTTKGAVDAYLTYVGEEIAPGVEHLYSLSTTIIDSDRANIIGRYGEEFIVKKLDGGADVLKISTDSIKLNDGVQVELLIGARLLGNKVLVEFGYWDPKSDEGGEATKYRGYQMLDLASGEPFGETVFSNNVADDFSHVNMETFGSNTQMFSAGVPGKSIAVSYSGYGGQEYRSSSGKGGVVLFDSEKETPVYAHPDTETPINEVFVYDGTQLVNVRDGQKWQGAKQLSEDKYLGWDREAEIRVGIQEVANPINLGSEGIADNGLSTSLVTDKLAGTSNICWDDQKFSVEGGLQETGYGNLDCMAMSDEGIIYATKGKEDLPIVVKTSGDIIDLPHYSTMEDGNVRFMGEYLIVGREIFKVVN